MRSSTLVPDPYLGNTVTLARAAMKKLRRMEEVEMKFGARMRLRVCNVGRTSRDAFIRETDERRELYGMRKAEGAERVDTRGGASVIHRWRRCAGGVPCRRDLRESRSRDC